MGEIVLNDPINILYSFQLYLICEEECTLSLCTSFQCPELPVGDCFVIMMTDIISFFKHINGFSISGILFLKLLYYVLTAK